MTYRESESLKTFRRVSIAAVIGVLVLLGLIIISQILGGSNFSTWSTRLIALLGLLLCYLTVLLAAAMVIDRGRLVPLMWIDIAAATFAMMQWTAMINGSSDALFGWRAGGVLTVCVFALTAGGHLGTLELTRPLLRSLRSLTLVGLVCFAFLCSAVIIQSVTSPLLIWFVVMLGLLSLLGTTVISSLVRRPVQPSSRTPADSIDKNVELTMTCPKCAAVQTQPCGMAVCKSCRQVMESWSLNRGANAGTFCTSSRPIRARNAAGRCWSRLRRRSSRASASAGDRWPTSRSSRIIAVHRAGVRSPPRRLLFETVCGTMQPGPARSK